jgi:hypothetical protein
MVTRECEECGSGKTHTFAKNAKCVGTRPGVELYFPLNKKSCLRMKKGIEPKGRMAEGGRLDEINGMIMTTAVRYLYSHQGHRRIGRIFDERGCKVKAGVNAFMAQPGPTQKL